MTREVIFEKLNAIFQDVFDDENLIITPETTAKDVEDWDSLTHIVLISSIEEEFDIHFDMKVVQQMKNVGDMANNIEELLK